MYVVVNVTVYKEQVAFKVSGKLLVGVYTVFECGITFLRYLLKHSMVLLAPPAVVDAVVVVSGT